MRKRSGMARRHAQPLTRTKKSNELKSSAISTDTSSQVCEPEGHSSIAQTPVIEEAAGVLPVHKKTTDFVLRGALHRYGLAHCRQIMQSMNDLYRRFWSNTFIILMLGATLFIPLVFYSSFQNVTALKNYFNPNPIATVFFNSSVSHARALEIVDEFCN